MTKLNQTDLSLSEETENAVEIEKYEEELLQHAVMRLNGNILGLVLGLVGGLFLFIATNWLVLKGGENTGQHLGLLSQYFIGYSVTFVGSLIGAAYIFVIGYLCGFLIALIYNKIVSLKNS